MDLTIVICTHNRSALLLNCLMSINECTPAEIKTEVLVVANACTDDTINVLKDIRNKPSQKLKYSLRWTEVPQPGKSHALNAAISLINSPAAAYIDDDQVPARDFLVEVQHALAMYRDSTVLCGKLLPAWTGDEPSWVHDTGTYRIYPPPVASYDMGNKPLLLSTQDVLPPGGNLIVRKGIFTRIGGFSINHGPRGHDLLGGEDHEFLSRALSAGETLQYIPGIVQYHTVDREHLKLFYLLRKSYQRSRSVIRIQKKHHDTIPLYMWKKILIYLAHAVFSTNMAKTRFFTVRLASALGEVKGMIESKNISANGSD